jgi:putative Holliday junction resolvase
VIFNVAAAFRAALPGRGRLLGLDLGEKTIGIAISDPAWQVASPLSTIRRSKWSKDSAQLTSLVSERAIAGFVLGWPRNMDGSEGPRCQSVRQFAQNWEKLHPFPILLWDERLSTRAIERAMIEADMRRAHRARVIDQAAASYILQGALDALVRP